MKRLVALSLPFLAVWLAGPQAHARSYTALLPVDATSEEGQTRLARAKVRADLDALTYHFEFQTVKPLAGAAAATIVLNALRAPALRARVQAAAQHPGKQDPRLSLPPGVDPTYVRYTQRGFFTPETDQVKTLPEVFGATHTAHVGARPDEGFRINQLAAALRAHGLKAHARVAGRSLSDEQIRRELIHNLGSAGDYVIIKFSRSVLGQAGDTQISPLGAYDEKSDSFLVLDVDPSASPWVWVKSKDLIAAIRSTERGDDRGYVLVADRDISGRQTASR